MVAGLLLFMLFWRANFFRCFLFSFCFLLAPFFLAAQEKVRKTETISTAPKIIIGKIKISETQNFEVKAPAVYTLTGVNDDNTLTGNFVLTLPEEARQKIARANSKQAAEIPATATVKDVGSKLENKTHCPEIRLEFAALEIEFSGTKIHVDRFVLILTENPQKLSRALCIWAERTNKGDKNNGIVQYINLLLKGEEEEEKPSAAKPT